MSIRELKPTDSHKSFYGKAHIIEDGKDVYLKSYDTIVMMKHGDQFIRMWDDWSATTGRHIRAFAGLDKKEYMALPFFEG